MVFEELAKSMLTFVNYGITIVFILIIVEVIKLISFGGTGAAVSRRLTDWQKSPVLKFLGLTKVQQARAKTRLLSEYVEEQKATGLLDDARAAAQDALREVQHTKAGAQITEKERDDTIQKIEGLRDKLKEARGEYRRVNKATWRQERQMGPILQKLKDEGQNVNDLVSLENNILKLHKEIIDEVDNALNQFDKMKADVKALKDEPATHFPLTIAGGALATPLNNVGTNLKHVAYKLTEAFDKQTEVDKEVQGIISKARQMWTA